MHKTCNKINNLRTNSDVKVQEIVKKEVSQSHNFEEFHGNNINVKTRKHI